MPGCESVADTRLLAEGRVLPASQLPPLWSICVQEGGGGPSGVPQPSTHSSAGHSRAHPAGSPPWGRLETLPRGPLLLTTDAPGAHPTGSASPSGTRPPWPALVRSVPEPGCRGPRGASVHCTCHRVPSTQLVSCLTVWTRRRSTEAQAWAQRVPGPFLLRAHVNMYISQAWASGEGLPQARFSCADLYNYLFKGTWIIMK